MGLSFQRILVPLFTFIWWNRLHEQHPYYPDKHYRRQVVKVMGWRSALVDGFAGQRMGISWGFSKSWRLFFKTNSK